MPWEQLLGPWGLVVAALIAVGVLWRDHVKADDRERATGNTYRDLHSGALARLDRLADAVEQLTKAVDRMDERRASAIAEAVEQLAKRLKP